MRVPRRGFLAAGAAAAAAPWGQAWAGALHRDHVLGASFTMRVNGPAAQRAAAERAALAEIARLDAVLSGWRADSELAALNASAAFRASPMLFHVIAYGEALRARSDGAFSPRLGAITARRRAGSFAAAARKAAIAAAEGAAIRLDPARQTISKPVSLAFDVDAYAKGFVIDRALAAARRAAPDARGVLIEIGGDIAAWGDGGEERGWRVGIAAVDGADGAAPVQTLVLHDAALAVSGRGPRDVIEEGARASHLIDPRTGAPVGVHATAVRARTALEADALATAFAAMTAARMLEMEAATPGLAARIVTASGDIIQSPRWRALAAEGPCQAASAWPSGYQLNVSFEIPRLSVRDYEKPYIAVWITDETRRLVRTLLVLGDEARWRENNYIWWRRYERADVTAVQAIARPTRAPGRYQVQWDGRDNAGAAVGQGAFTLNVESSREHGAHAYQSIPLTLGGAAVSASAPAQDELGAIDASFGPPQ